MKLLHLPSLILCSFLVSCSAMNSKFSCNVTSGDSCLTIEEVEAMTQFANGTPNKGQTRQRQVRHTIYKADGKNDDMHPATANRHLAQEIAPDIWLAPQQNNSTG